MDEVFNDSEKVTSSEPKEPKSTQTVKPNITLFPLNNGDPKNPNISPVEYPTDNIDRSNSYVNTGLERKEIKSLGSYYLSQNPQKLLAQNQSWYEQLGNTAGHIVTNFLGDTVSSIGNTYQIGKDISNEIKNKDAEFTNDFIEFGNSIKDWGKNNLKNYKENPNESWDVKDPAWWFDGIESAFSGLSYLVGGVGLVKGLSGLAKLIRAEKLLAKAGANVEKLKLGTKIAASATFARNAENMMESYQVRQDVKNNLLKEWENKDEFDKVKNSEVGKELLAENRELTKENLANFIAGKAGWKTYAINSLNIVFDAMQLAPIFKGFNPNTSISKLNTSSKILDANKKLLNESAKSSAFYNKVFDVLNPTISSIGRSASEGLEEAINFIGEKEGKNLSKQLTNKDNSSFSSRLSNYLKSGDLYESAFWGTLGGAIFQKVADGTGKILNKGINSNTETDLRIGEINNRLNILKDASEKIKQVNDSENLDNNSKKDIISKVKSELALHLGVTAAQSGNIELLVEQIKSKEFKDKLVDLGIAQPIDVEKATSKTISDVLLAEKLYKQYYNNFYLTNTNAQVKDSLIKKSIITDYFINKTEEKKNILNKELQDLKENDQYIKNSTNKNLETLLYIKSLEVSKNAIKDYIQNANTKEDELLSTRGKEELNKINNKIEELKKQVGEDTIDFSQINPEIISKQSQIVFAEGINNIQSAKINEYRSNETIKKEEDKIKQNRKDFEDNDFEQFKKEVDKKVEDNVEIEELQKLKDSNKEDKRKVNFLNTTIKSLQGKNEIEKRKKDTSDIIDSPVNNGDIFKDLPEFQIDENFNENSVNPSWKPSLDKFIEDKDIENIKGVTGDTLALTNPNEVQYVKNKVQRLRNELLKQKEVIELNTEQLNNQEFEFNEEAQQEIIRELTKENKIVTLDDLGQDEEKEINFEKPNEFDFLSKEVIKGNIRTYIPIFGYGLKNFRYKDFFTISKGSIVVKDKYVDTIKTLMNPDFKEGDEIEILWDKDNAFTLPEWKGDIKNEAFKLTHKGVVISYLPTEASTLKEIELHKRLYKETGEEWHNELVNKLKLELPYTLQLRNQLSLDDKSFKIKLSQKGNGTVISRGVDVNNLKSVKNIFNDFYALDPKSFLDKTKLLNISNDTDTFDGVSQLRPGVIYGKLISANNTAIPVPLFVSKVTQNQAKEIQSDIEKLLILLNQGKNTENQEVKDLKDSIGKYVKVDKFSNYDKPIGFRVFPQGKKEDGTTTEARIEMSYYENGQKILTVIRLSTNNSNSYVGVFKDGKKLSQTTLDSKDFLDILQKKYQNVDFFKLTKNEPFEKYNSYKEYLIEEEVIKTDIAQVVDSKGNVLSNLFGFNNDFTIAINYNQENNVFKSKDFEQELKAKDTISENLEYRKNYSLYNNSIVDANTILQDILKNPQNKNIEEVSKWLNKNINKASFTTQLVNKDLAYGNALYSTEKNSILVSKDKKYSEVYLQQTLLHEMLHGFTVPTILKNIVLTKESYKNFKKVAILDINSIEFKKDSPEYVKDFVKYIVELRNDSINKLTKKYGKSLEGLTEDTKTFYGLENPFEFISEAMINPNFRNELRKLDNGINKIQQFYNKIVDFINKLFGFNISKIEDNNLKNAVNAIKNFIDNQDIVKPVEFDDISFSKLDKFYNNFTREEILQTINSFQGIILGIVKDKNLSTTNRQLKNILFDKINNYTKDLPESLKTKFDLVEQFKYEFFDETIKRINKEFNISLEDIENIDENEDIVKDYNDLSAQKIASQDTVTNQIKSFIKTIPLLNSLNTTVNGNNEILWDIKYSNTTGLPTFIDFNTIYPYLSRNLIGARSMSEIIDRLNSMSKINISFFYIAEELKKDINLLAQFESNLAKKYLYDSLVAFISNEEYKKIWISNELKNTKQEYLIADEWANNINKIINNIKDSKDKLEFDKRITSIYLKIAKNSKDFINNINTLTEDIYELANELGIDVSYPVIKGQMESIRNWNDLEILKTLQNIYESIYRGKKSDSYGRLNSLAKLESILRFDIVENSGLDIKGNLIYGIRNPNFISNWFSLAKSTTKEGKQEFEEYLINISKIPEMQFSNWLWNDNNYKGFLNYEIINNIKVFKSVNLDFVRNFNFHNLGGAKEVISKNSQSYTDFSEKDWMLVNLINYIRPEDKTERNQNKEKDYVFLPSLIPSDSGTMYLFEIAKIRLGKDDLIKKDKNYILNENSKLFKSVFNTVAQEVKRIQQATNEIFDIIDDKLVVKKDLDITKLQQYYHYDKQLNIENLTESLLDKKGNPIGKAFYFNNMIVKEGNKFITLNDVEGIKINGHLNIGTLSPDVIRKLKDFTNKFISQQINNSIKDYQIIQEELQEKYDNISNGTFENLIAEYVLNTYISNIEQFNFFNGNIAEYKSNIDSNKRAKHMFTPGIALSIEAMKMKLENGSFSTGTSFQAITLKDVKTKSNTINFITESVKDLLIKERPNTYSEKEINNFNLNGNSNLDKDVFKIVKDYLNINASDAQGYITLDRYEQILRGLGRFTLELETILNKLRKNENISIAKLKVLQPIKGFCGGRDYNNISNRLISNQIKYSSMPLIPSLVKNTELEKLMNFMNEKGIQEAFYESAHKIGATSIYNIHNEDGTINEESFKNIVPTTYYNKNWQLQLDVPDHILDEQNLLGTQIAKLVIANLDKNSIYELNNKTYTGEELIEHYFNILESNIIESADKLLEDLGVIKDGDNFIIKDIEIQKVLLKEIERRGLSENYNFAIELDENGNFKLPLFINNMATKWEAILTSLFTNRIVKQKLPGGSAVLGSRLFLDSNITQSENTSHSIEWSKEKLEDKKLKSYRNENGILVVEVLLGAWSSELYDNNTRINIDNIPDEVKTMIGYRIPTQAKNSMMVFKVVGLLPNENRGLIITPDDLVVQMGSDFDIDKLFIINKNFYVNDNKEFIVPNINNEKEEYNNLKKEVKTLNQELAIAFDDDNDIESTKLIDSIFNQFSENSLSIDEAKQDINKSLNKVNNRIKELLVKNNDKYELRKDFSKKARQNEIFNIYHSILTNKNSLKEIFTPSDFEDFKKVKKELDIIFKEGDNSINPSTELGQRIFRRRNIGGRSLKGIAANLNAFGAVAQVSKMELNPKLSIVFKFNLDDYNVKLLKDRYKENITIKDSFAVIKFNKLGYAPDGSYLNIDNDLILEHASQGVGAAVDIVKDPTFDAFNATTYTYPLFHTMLLTGIPTRLAAFFIRQPILKNLNDYYFDNKSLLEDGSGNEIEVIKRFYQTQLFIELVKQNKLNNTDSTKKALKVIKKRKDNNITNTYDKKYLIYVDKKDTKDLLNYNIEELQVLDIDILKTQLELKVKGYNTLSDEEKLNYLKTQLEVLEYFNTWKKASEGVQDILKITKTDAIGAGPSMSVSSNLFRNIEKLKYNERILIENTPAVKKVYPSYFNINENSVYSPLENYLNFANKLSINVLNNLFINQSESFKNSIYTINGMLNRSLKEDEINQVNKFLNISILQDFNNFKSIKKEDILGINKKVINNTKDFNTFSSLSLANKIKILKEEQKEFLKENSQHILNFLNPLLDDKDISKNGYHKLDFIFYKNEFTDDNLTDSIIKMYENGDEFEKNVAEDLINYSFIVDGLTFGAKSFSKVIPNKILYNLGIGEYLKNVQKTLNNVNVFDKNIIDLLFKNNWNNSSLVPTVKTLWEYEIKNNKKVIKTDAEGNKLTKDNSPIWNTENDFIVVPDKSLKNLKDTIKTSPYITIYNTNKKELLLYKKHILENDTVTNKSSFNGNSYYYRVNKLGKQGIFEFTKDSIFQENNSQLSENVLISKIENVIAKIEEKRIANLEIKNTEKSKEDEIINRCKYDK